MFSKTFIELPVKIVDRHIQELCGKAPSEDSYIKIRREEIVKYRPSWDGDDPDQNEIVCITDTLGETTLVYLTIDEFEKLMNGYA